MAVVTKILLAMLALLQSFLSYLESLYFMPSVLERKSSHLLLAGQSSCKFRKIYRKTFMLVPLF